jgi:hypothetical protein
VSDELELLRGFRAEDSSVDAASAHAARSRLLAHIAQKGRDETGARASRRRRRLPLAVGVRSDLLAVGFTVALVIALVVVFLGVGGHRAPRRAARGPILHGNRPMILRNLAPESPPRLPGQLFCDANLDPPGAVPGLSGPRSGVILVNATTIRGVNESPFAITARGLAPSARVGEYAVWITQVGGVGSGAVPLPGAKPRLLGVVAPGVGRDGKLALEGVVPSDITIGGTYIVRITVQPHSILTKPGRTLLEGVGPL